MSPGNTVLFCTGYGDVIAESSHGSAGKVTIVRNKIGRSERNKYRINRLFTGAD